MSIRGSQIRKQSNDIELNRLVQEFTEKLEHDPYQPGIVHPEIYPDDIQEIIEDNLMLRGFSEITIRVKKNPDGMSVETEVLTRNK